MGVIRARIAGIATIWFSVVFFSINVSRGMVGVGILFIYLLNIFWFRPHPFTDTDINMLLQISIQIVSDIILYP